MNVINKKILLFILGTRPEAIKLAPIILGVKKSVDLEAIVCITGQHKEMLYQALDIFGIKPHFDLEIMAPNQDLASLSSKLISGLSSIILDVKPSLIIVQGDTTSAFVGALIAFYHKIPVAHVESGLRTNDKYSPFPEEINRRLITQIANLHFAPTSKAKENLLKESIDPDIIFVTGNTVVDALHQMIENLTINYNFSEFDNIVINKKVVLITAHRRENFGDGILNICEAVKRLSSKFKEVNFIYPVHLNPNVQDIVYKNLNNIKNVILLKPLNYINFTYLLSKSYLILTDSGGVQEEAPTFKIPVLILREETERSEAVDAGVAKLIGTNSEKIYNSVNLLLNDSSEYMAMISSNNPFGDGKASDRIIDIIKSAI